MAGPGRPPKNRDDLLADLQAQTAVAAKADAEDDTPPPDTVEIGGVTYYRQRAAAPMAEYVDPDPGFERVLIDIAPFTNQILVDGKRFMAGGVYRVTVAEAVSLRDQMARTWEHEKSTGGAYSKMPSAKGQRMSMTNGMVAPGAMGAPGVIPALGSKM